MRRRVPWGLLAALFVVVPLVELYILIQVGQVIGALWTILALIAVSVLGSYLIKREGSRAWAALRNAIQTGRMPARELADGALILIGGTLLLTPGFLSDALGLLFVLPFTRPVARRALTGFVTRRFLGGPRGAEAAGRRGPRTRQRPGTDEVIRGEVVD